MSMRGTSIHDEVVPLCGKLIRLGIETRGVSEIGVDRFYWGVFVPHFDQPLWSLRMAATGIYDQIGMQCTSATLPSLATPITRVRSSVVSNPVTSVLGTMW